MNPSHLTADERDTLEDIIVAHPGKPARWLAQEFHRQTGRKISHKSVAGRRSQSPSQRYRRAMSATAQALDSLRRIGRIQELPEAAWMDLQKRRHQIESEFIRLFGR